MTAQRSFIAVDGETFPLRLTLGALAEIEAALGGDLSALGDRLKRLSVGDLLLILRALIAGGGRPVTLEFLKAADIDVAAAAHAVAAAFEALEAPGKTQAGAESGASGSVSRSSP